MGHKSAASPFRCALAVLVAGALMAGCARESWRSLAARAQDEWAAGDTSAARSLASACVDAAEARSRGDDSGKASALDSLGVLLYRCSDLFAGEAMLKRAVEMRRCASPCDSISLARSIHHLAVLLESWDRRFEADSLFDEAIRLRERTLGPDHVDVGYSLCWLGVLKGRRPQEFAVAESCLVRGERILSGRLGPQHIHVGWAVSELAVVLMREGRYEEAERATRHALAIRNASVEGASIESALLLYNCGTVLFGLGLSAEAEPLLRTAVDIGCRALDPRHPKVAFMLNSLANLCHSHARYDEAERIHLRVLAARRSRFGVCHPDIVQTLSNLGALYTELGRDADAEPLLRCALRYSPKDPYTLDDLGNLCGRLGLFGEAGDLIGRALQIRLQRYGSDHPLLAENLASLGRLRLREGCHREAASLLQSAVTLRREALGGNHPALAEALSELARAHTELRAWGPAKDAAREALAIRQRNFRDGFDVLSERDALLAAGRLRHDASVYLSILCACGDSAGENHTEIARVVFSTKGLVSDGILSRHRAQSESSQPGVHPLADSLRAARLELARLYGMNSDPASLAEYRVKLAEAGERKERLEAALAQRSAVFRPALERADVDASQLARLLPPGAVLLTYHRYDRFSACDRPEAHYLAILLDHEGRTSVKELGLATRLDSLVAWHRDGLLSPERDGGRNYARAANDLYLALVAPFEAGIRDARTLLIVPDGSLNLLSFASLVDSDGRFLIETHAVHYLSSARDIIRLQSKPPLGEGLLAMGDPELNGRSRLLGSRREVEKIAEDWRKTQSAPADVRVGAEATEEYFLRCSVGKRVIHLATHAFSYDIVAPAGARNGSTHRAAECLASHPLLASALLLAATGPAGETGDSAAARDGVLTAEEIVALDLEGTEVVILSGCETGLGEIKTGEGVFGLTRAFELAGARTVIAALWPVRDFDAGEVAARLYSASGGTLPEILQRVTLDYLQARRAAGLSDHPAYWAAFVAKGDWRILPSR